MVRALRIPVRPALAGANRRLSPPVRCAGGVLVVPGLGDHLRRPLAGRAVPARRAPAVAPGSRLDRGVPVGVRRVRRGRGRYRRAARSGARPEQPDRPHVHGGGPRDALPARLASQPRPAHVAHRFARPAAMAVADNLRGLALVSWRGSDAEPLGAAVLFACLGTIAARRVFAGAQRLVAVDKELDIARRIQSSILPAAPPAAAGLVVAARYRPMTAVAGDFYEFLHAGDRQLGILVADVSGHGIPAALLASMVKVAIAAQKAHAPQPAAVLAGMNATLLGQLGGQYVTAAYLFLDREAGLFRYGAAGHPPLLYWPRGSEPREVEENGLPLGLMDIAQYAAGRAPAPGWRPFSSLHGRSRRSGQRRRRTLRGRARAIGGRRRDGLVHGRRGRPRPGKRAPLVRADAGRRSHARARRLRLKKRRAGVVRISNGRR